MGFWSFLFGGGAKATKKVEPKKVVETVPVEPMSEEQTMEHFRTILSKEFPDYLVKENVAVTEVVGDANDMFKLYETRPTQAYKAEWGQPYNFVMYKDGKIAGIVMIIGKKSTRKVKILISKMYAQKAGVPYITFYYTLPNRYEYVVKRIKERLIA
ncbi:MAG: hypothetical protein E7119_08600 [Bacteroidales bacterium]|nr:hypothetical protein [Bacteroidales bacterium]